MKRNVSAALIVAIAFLIAVAITVFDHGMRKQQAIECGLGDEAMPCPETLWWFDQNALL